MSFLFDQQTARAALGLTSLIDPILNGCAECYTQYSECGLNNVFYSRNMMSQLLYSVRQAAAGWLSVSGEDASQGCLLSWPCLGAPRCSECRGPLKASLPDLGSVATLRGDSIVFLASGIQGPGPGGWAALQCCLGQHFVVLLERNEQHGGRHCFLLLVLLLGTARQAERFSYRLVLSRQRRRLTWEASPRGLTGTVSPSAATAADSLVFDTVVAQLFADNGSLAINVTISSCP
ncbi:E3 ubiquitin-protein ligase SIAH2-like [Rhincodon typus]|uniref:E3 ubiquitin-protein ligase SIAH2-like n=1 Tax=Rhincodon typus TaxID=259920 RepID=UPI00202DF9B9|nr:E3 ubiquitin-protein ligase SIAH2-like [Rhincodon typus]